MSLGRWQKVGRLARTLRWLRREQWLGRAALQLRRLQPLALQRWRAGLDRAAPALRAAAGAWALPARREPSLLAGGRLQFLGEVRELDHVGWDDAAVPLLWRYNQHYFDDLNAEGAAERREAHLALRARWMRENPQGQGTAWAPYPSSLRIANWVKAFHGGLPFDAEALQHLACQVRWLSGHLEWHLLGNHLFVNAKALVMAGLLFDGAEAKGWRKRGWAVIERELPEQILPDGGHFERSPMYHALALEDLLDLLNACRRAGQDLEQAMRLQALAQSMLTVLLALCDDQGRLRRFNDSADGIAPSLPELQRYARELGVQGQAPAADTWLPDTGYLRRQRGRATAWLDLAPIGPDYLPGHAHADTLSFELQLDGQDLIVNRGTSIYGDGARRQWERGTAAHSTVMRADENSSETWAGFRVGRRARIVERVIEPERVSAAHNGYAHHAGAPLHRRQWTWLPQGLRVEDQLPGPAVARYPLAPGLSAQAEAEPGHWTIRQGGQLLARLSVEQGGAITLEDSQHAVGFGLLAAAQTLVLPLREGRAAVRLEWTA